MSPQKLEHSTRSPLQIGVMLSVTLLLWASAFPAISVALRSYSPEHLALGRYLIASAVLALVAAAQRFPLPAWRDCPRIALGGLSGFALYNVALNEGQTRVPAGIASFLVNTAPVWTLVWITLAGRERVLPRGWLGVAISLAGVALIAVARDSSLQLDTEFLRGTALVLLAAFGTSFYVLLQKRLLETYGALQLTTYMIWAGTLWMLPFVPGLAQSVREAQWSDTVAMVYMGVLPGALAYALWARVLAQTEVSRAVSFIYLVPVAATIIAWLWLGERIAPLALVGGLIVLVGVALVNTARRPTTR